MFNLKKLLQELFRFLVADRIFQGTIFQRIFLFFCLLSAILCCRIRLPQSNSSQRELRNRSLWLSGFRWHRCYRWCPIGTTNLV